MTTINGVTISPGVTIGPYRGIASPATQPTSITLSVGSVTPVGNVTNVSIPAANGTDTTGTITGWVASTANKIKFTVVDGGSATSTITIGGVSYTSGTDYSVAAAGSITVIVTTSEPNKFTVTRTFIISVTAAAGLVVGDPLGGGVYIGTTQDTGGVTYNLILSPYNDGASDRGYFNSWPQPNRNLGGASTVDGLYNTNYIISQPGNETSGAAKYYADLSMNGYDDWYWPSKTEITTMASAIKLGVLSSEFKGPFLDSFRYWSSSVEFSIIVSPFQIIYYAWSMDSDVNKTIFRPRADGVGGSMSNGRVRCVRRQLP